MKESFKNKLELFGCIAAIVIFIGATIYGVVWAFDIPSGEKVAFVYTVPSFEYATHIKVTVFVRRNLGFDFRFDDWLPRGYLSLPYNATGEFAKGTIVNLRVVYYELKDLTQEVSGVNISAVEEHSYNILDQKYYYFEVGQP